MCGRVFVKGSPDAPRCGFSSQLIDILRNAKVQFDYFDILTDNDVREGLKKLSNWPTYPQVCESKLSASQQSMIHMTIDVFSCRQVYAQGKLVGGLDIIKELVADGSLEDALSAH